MGQEKREPTGIMVSEIDVESWLAEGKSGIMETLDMEGDWEFTTKAFGVVETPVGLFAFDTDGIGPSGTITEFDPLVVPIFAKSCNSIELFPRV